MHGELCMSKEISEKLTPCYLSLVYRFILVKAGRSGGKGSSDSKCSK